jgi:hypothetical protein
MGFACRPTVSTGGHRQPGREARAWLAADGKTEMPLEVGEPVGAPRHQLCGLGQTFGKRLARTDRVQAAEAPHLNPQRHQLPLAGQITERAFVPSVQMGGRRFTAGASGRCLVQAGDDDEVTGRRQDLLDDQPCRKKRHELRWQEPMLKRKILAPYVISLSRNDHPLPATCG